MTTTAKEEELERPPPKPLGAVLPLTVQFIRVSVPRLSTPPPLPPALPALLPLTVLFVRVRVPWLKMPPPLAALALPPDMVKPEMLTVARPILKMRKLGPPLRCTVRRLAPGPLMLMLWLISGRTVSKLIGLTTPLKLISIVPHDVSAFASSIAARKVQTAPFVAHSPSPGFASLASPLLLTVNVVGHGSSFMIVPRPSASEMVAPTAFDRWT